MISNRELAEKIWAGLMGEGAVFEAKSPEFAAEAATLTKVMHFIGVSIITRILSEHRKEPKRAKRN